MIPSMFTLDHRLSEIRPSAEELRVARELRESGGSASRPARSIGEILRAWLGGEAPGHLASGASR